MSQHCFYTHLNGKPVTVLMGWDRPLQGYFMVIDHADPEAQEDEPIWSNLIHHHPSHPKTLDSFLRVLEEFGIKLPPEMVAGVLEDGANNVGNKWVEYR